MHYVFLGYLQTAAHKFSFRLPDIAPVFHPPWGGSKLSWSDSEKRISGRGALSTSPRPEKFFEFFDPP
jgi:hypothetical protein